MSYDEARKVAEELRSLGASYLCDENGVHDSPCDCATERVLFAFAERVREQATPTCGCGDQWGPGGDEYRCVNCQCGDETTLRLEVAGAERRAEAAEADLEREQSAVYRISAIADRLESQLSEAQQRVEGMEALCRIYFEIAEGFMPADEIRAVRDAEIARASSKEPAEMRTITRDENAPIETGPRNCGCGYRCAHEGLK